MGTALPLSNPYGIILSALLLGYLFLFLAYMLFLSFRIDGDRFRWDCRSGTAPFGGEGDYGRDHMALSSPEAPPLLTTWLFTGSGRLFAGDIGLYRRPFARTFDRTLSWGNELPLPGLFRCRGRFYLSDLFGFLRLALTDYHHREILYYPPLLGNLEIPRPSSAEESEETVRTSPSNPERVFMRDYQPGDLARDINWKASGKFSAIYTRIAPDAADTTTKLTLVIRTNGLSRRSEPERSALLLGIKAFSLTLLTRLIRDNPESLIILRAGGRTFSSDEEPLAEKAFPHVAAMGWAGGEEDLPEPGSLIVSSSADPLGKKLSDGIPSGLYIITAGSVPGTEEGNLAFSYLKGNNLPQKPLLIGLSPGAFKYKPPGKALPDGDRPPAEEERGACFVEVRW